MPAQPHGTGVLVLAGSSGRADAVRARLLAEQGETAESIRWFGGEGQQPGPWEVPLEQFFARIEALRRDVDRVVLLGLSFGAEAALLVGSLRADVDAVAAFSGPDVVWAGVRPDGTQTSHWTLDGDPVPFVRFDETWHSEDDPPVYRGMYQASLARGVPPGARIAVERIPEVVLVGGGDDLVWPAYEYADRIVARREHLPTVDVRHDSAGHRAVLPGEEPVVGGQAMARGGDPASDRELGRRAWPHLLDLIAPASAPGSAPADDQ